MKKEICSTGDGSHSIRIPEWDIQYHSRHGAIGESSHIFIQSGLNSLLNQPDISVFEMGFGTGLNALLTLITAANNNIYYEAIEQFPVDAQQAGLLNYTQALNRPDLQPCFVAMHTAPFDMHSVVKPGFVLHKRNGNMVDAALTGSFDIIYFDAFDPVVQPELWTPAVFSKLFAVLRPGGMLLTYCSKTIVRNAMRQAGFSVSKIPGPYGKREIVRAVSPRG